MAAITFFSSASMKIVYQIYRLFLQLEIESHKINQALFYNSHTNFATWIFKNGVNRFLLTH